MASVTTNSSLARTRSLRIPTSSNLKPSTAPTPGPSYVTLFLTNLRLLNLDLRDDWPNITQLTFSTKDVQQNQKRRIQSVEWALFHLFALWDSEETSNKLSPFFPPLDQLQSLNLRAALFRCLDQAKKIGVLGRDTVLRKTMLDECKGERLEEVLAVFSNVVLKKVLEGNTEVDRSIAKELALENFSYSGERTVLSALILAHKVSINRQLWSKNDTRARYHDFSELLSLNERRIARRHEQLKDVIEKRGLANEISHKEVHTLQSAAQRNWSGNDKWLDTILYGDNRPSEDDFLATGFGDIWKHVEAGSIGDVEGTNRNDLANQLEVRVKDQESRLAKWQAFSRSLNERDGPSPTKKTFAPTQRRRIDLGFDKHEELQVDWTDGKEVTETAVPVADEYSRLIWEMKAELAAVSNPVTLNREVPQNNLVSEIERSPISSPIPDVHCQPVVEDDGWSSVSDELDEPSPGSESYAAKSTSQTPPSELAGGNGHPVERRLDFQFKKPAVSEKQHTPKEREKVVVNRAISPPLERTPSPLAIDKIPRQRTPEPAPPQSQEAELADQILNSMAAASPSPKKRHTLSLAERTRLSMSRTSHSQFSDLHDEFEIADLSRLSIKPRHSISSKTTEDPETELHADLIERTRKSMAGFEAAQKKAQLERRRSVRDEKKKQRQSSYFPKVEEEAITPDISAVEMIEGDPDYESVFKSRPKIKTSPAVSPSRIYEDENED